MSNILIFFLLSIFWLINSAIFHEFLLFLGGFSVFTTFLIYRFMIKITKNSSDESFDFFEKLPKSPRMIVFLSTTIFEICKSSLSFMKNILLNKKIDLSVIECNIQNADKDSIMMFIAHSITVTPGSIAIFEDASGNLKVHCLYKEIRDDVENAHDYKNLVEFMNQSSPSINSNLLMLK